MFDMEITVVSSKSIKPACAAPATVQVVPLTVFDKANFDTYVSAVYAFQPPTPSNAVLEAGLAKALVDYREWAGRLDRNLCNILLNDAGARFVAATAAVALETVMPLRPTPELLKLHPSGGDGDELMQIQVTRFACGSLVVGITAHHKVADGGGRCKFILAWGRATRGVSVPRPPPLLHDRPSVFAPRSPLRIEHEHRGVEYCKPRADRDSAVHQAGSDDDDVVVVERVHFSLDLIAELKLLASAGATATGSKYTTFQEEGLVPTADASEMVLRPDVEVDSWLRIPFYDLDLGGGRPCFFTPSYLPVEGVVILAPCVSGDGSLDAYVPLFSRDMDTFNRQ